ncbi:hypothetical protein B0I35DRAFT_483171 [Stachybotrys elegans]|uniref:Nephrocystin 3-like N-terminal domain-containing protein n=1 Tax=Stachybotrys elegans TaxID=80388 RepID=A0A8K0WLF0_9HYPO|nr:hypothetical protein B0I35DRAFT_483171 [Stachybotrys elegans]
MIEHIQQESFTPNHLRDGKKALVFFFFDKQNPDKVSSGGFWCAALVQLLHAMSAHDPDILDIFLLFRENRLSGQRIASDNEIFIILSLLVQRLTRILLIVDGVDECIDPPIFFQRFGTLLDVQCDMMAVIFSRPTLVIPSKIMDHISVCLLALELNLHDITMYVRPRVAQLIRSGFLPKSHNTEEITAQIAARANGMFLWATLF